MTQAKPRMLARLGLLSRAPLPAALGLAVAVGCIAVETAIAILLKTLNPGNEFGVL